VYGCAQGGWRARKNGITRGGYRLEHVVQQVEEHDAWEAERHKETTLIPSNLLNTVTKGNALRLLDLLPDESIDAVITDPPYSSGGQFRGDRAADTSNKYQSPEARGRYEEFSGDTRDQRGYLHWCALWMGECWRAAKPGAPICIFTDWRQLPATTDALQAGGWVWRGIVPWDKTEAARPQKGRFRAQCEYIVWGSKGQLWSDGKPDRPCLPGVYRKAVNSSTKTHIAEKDLSLMRFLMQIAPPGGVVLDCFTGSGATLVAAAEDGLQYIGFELDGHWTTQAARRTSVVRAPLLFGLDAA
jgi:site-specific DNA-methyltransferase (adenine-specific)